MHVNHRSKNNKILSKIEFTLKEFASVAGSVNGSTNKMDNTKKTATSKPDKRNQEMDSMADASNYMNKNNARTSNEYRPLSSVSDDLVDMSHLRGTHIHKSSLVAQGQPGKRSKTEIVTQGRRHNFEIQPSRYRGSSHTHLGQLPSIEGTGSATAAANKTGYNSEYA